MTTTSAPEPEASERARTSWKRKLVIASVIAFALLVVSGGTLWILKPWVLRC